MLPLLGAALAFSAKLFAHARGARLIEYAGACIGLALPLLVIARLFPIIWAGKTISGVIGSWHEGIGITFRFDGLALLINVLGYSVGIAAWIYSLGGGPKGATFTGVFLIQSAALSATIMTADLFNLFVCLEVMGMTSYVLIPTSKKPGASLASFSYLMVSASAMVFFLLGTYGFYRLTGSLSYAGIEAGLRTLESADRLLSIVSLALLVSAVAIRVAVMPLYGWLPDAHALAPHAVSAVLSGVLIKTPLFALARIMHLLPEGTKAGQLMSAAGAVTAVVAVVIALSQSDAKRLLAYHSISQIGYIVAAWGMALRVGAATPHGVLLMTGAFLHAFNHALFKGLLFLSVGTTVDLAQERNVYRLRGAITVLRSHGERIPITFIAFLVGTLSIAAIPPLNGFMSKNLISYGLKEAWHYHALTIASVGTAASFIKLSRIFWPAQKGSLPLQATLSTSIPHSYGARVIAQIMLALLCVATGAWAGRLIGFVGALLAPAGILLPAFPDWYAPDSLVKTLWSVVGGAVLFFTLTSRFGSRLLNLIRTRPRDFQGLFISFSLGTAALVAFMMW
jgi:multicomponent Na+:H+ antiporter subunit D